MEYRSENQVRRAANAFCDKKKHGGLSIIAREAGLTRQTVARFVGGGSSEQSTTDAIAGALNRLGHVGPDSELDQPNEADSGSRFEIIGEKMIAIGKLLRSDKFSLDEKTRELELFVVNTARGLGIANDLLDSQ